MSRSLTAALVSLFAVVLIAAPGFADPLPAPGTQAWRPLALPGVDRASTYRIVAEDDRPVVVSESECSASALMLPTEQLDLGATPILSWRWRVDQELEIANERVKSGDDFAARVYVMFTFQPEHSSFGQRARHALGKALYGDVVPGSAINYVWSRREAAGLSWDNPFSAESKMVSLGAGNTGEWQSVRVDVAADFERLFERPVPATLGIALMTDSDNSCQAAKARFAEFEFLARDG